MEVVESISALRAARKGMTGNVGLVPTMGALHAGHQALVEAARAENDHVIATIFVNPTQFGPDEDLETYPRNLSADLDMLREGGVDLVFVPSVAVIYPAGFQTAVIVDQVTRRLEGELRPGHFRGVTTVVAKLFNLTQPTCAYFGQKDAQQVAVLRQMVRDLNFPLQMVVVPTVRETDGLALSSRNVYLKPDEREAARALYRALQAAASLYDAGERDTETLRLEAMDMLNAQELAAVDYVSVLDARTFQPVEGDVDALLIVVLAAKIGGPRLLDNALLPWSLNSRDGLTATLGAGVP